MDEDKELVYPVTPSRDVSMSKTFVGIMFQLLLTNSSYSIEQHFVTVRTDRVSDRVNTKCRFALRLRKSYFRSRYIRY